MKRLFLLFDACFITYLTFAQTWSCPEFDSDLAKYNEVAKIHNN